jgi:hypothetical protein
MNPLNLQDSPPTDLNVTLVLKSHGSGKVAASAVEFPQCQVEAENRETAIADLKILLAQHLQQIELVPVKIPLSNSLPDTNVWGEMFGVLGKNQYFDEVVEIIEAEREKLGDEAIDPGFYS